MTSIPRHCDRNGYAMAEKITRRPHPEPMSKNTSPGAGSALEATQKWWDQGGYVVISSCFYPRIAYGA